MTPNPAGMVAQFMSWVLTLRFETPKEEVTDGTMGRHSPAPGTKRAHVTSLMPGKDWGRLRGEGAAWVRSLTHFCG